MCGIVGFMGGNAVMNVLDGLAKLEYRGYDSAGLAYFNSDNSINIIKRPGRLDNVAKEIHDNGATWAKTAIGHTRWATHGEPSELNAHPHKAGKITIVHNGIIENYPQLSEYLDINGRQLVSETDTEIIAHLIDMPEGTLLQKVRMATALLQGSYAIAVISEDYPDEMVVARKGSPLVAGISSKGTIISSDIQGILKYTDQAYILQDGEFASLTKDSIRFYDHGSEISKNPIDIDWSLEDTYKGNFDTFMRKEIQEQPAAIVDTVMKTDWNHVKSFVRSINFSDALFVACGTSFNASKIGTIFLEVDGMVHSRARLASEVCYNTRIKPSTLVVAVSQSGETADTLSAARIAKQAGAKVLAIVNVMGSSLAREADYVIYTAAGPEISVASTKAFTSQLAVIYMLGAVFCDIKKGNTETTDGVRTDLENIGTAMHKVFAQEEKIKELAESIPNSSVLFLGRGIHTPVAYEGALKLKEISYLHAEGLPAGEIKHGPLALVSKGTPVVVLAIKGETYDKMMSNIREVQSRGARVIAIVTENDYNTHNLIADKLYIPYYREVLTPILSTLHLQLFAYHVARALGRDIDKPRNLAKSVTVE